MFAMVEREGVLGGRDKLVSWRRKCVVGAGSVWWERRKCVVGRGGKCVVGEEEVCSVGCVVGGGSV